MAPATIDRAVTTPSNLHRRQLCPGSARLEAGLTDRDSQDSMRGRLFHRYWTNPNYRRELLTPDERELLTETDRLHAQTISLLASIDEETELHVEETITGIDRKLTGTPDLVHLWLKANKSLVTDLKSGFKIVERAELNLQLRGYAVLVVENYFVTETVYIEILQPRAWSVSDRVTLAQYDLSDIAKARTQISEIIARTEDEKAPLVAGEEQCRFCKAKLICPAFRKALGLPLARIKTEADLSKLKREAEQEKLIKGCTDEQLEQLLSALSLASAIDDSVRAECRRRIRDGKFTKFMLGKDSEARSITSVRKAISMLALSNIGTREEITDLCTLSLKSLEDRYRARRRGVTWKQARDKIDRVLKSVIAREAREPKILTREKKK